MFRKIWDTRNAPYHSTAGIIGEAGPTLVKYAWGRSQGRPLHSPSLGTGVFQMPYATRYGTGLAGASLRA